MSGYPRSEHDASDHVIEGSPRERMRRIMARHLCGWISGHGAPVEHSLVDADVILVEADEHGLRFYLAGAIENVTAGDACMRIGGLP